MSDDINILIYSVQYIDTSPVLQPRDGMANNDILIFCLNVFKLYGYMWLGVMCFQPRMLSWYFMWVSALPSIPVDFVST